MRLRLNLLTLSLCTALAVPVVLTLPVATAPAATPHPVAPRQQHLALTGLDPVALADARSGGVQAKGMVGASAVRAGATGSGPRVAVLTRPMDVRQFTLAGVAWDRGPSAGTVPTTIQVRTRSLDGTWTDWSVLETSDASPDLGTAEYDRVQPHTEPIIAQDSDAVQVRVDTPDGTAPAGLRLDLVDPGTSPADGQVVTPPATSASASAPLPTIVSRAQWGADESLRDKTFKYTTTIKIAVVHHTASGNSYWQTGGDTLAAAAQDLRAIYAYSVSTGYADVPYNFLVDQAGRIYEGRAGGIDKAVMSAATGGFNTDTMSISALGNFQTARPSSALVSGIEQIAAWKLGLFHRDPTGQTAMISAGGGTDRWPVGASVLLNNISGHRDTGATACPGSYLYPYLPTVRTVARTLQQTAFYDPVVSPSWVIPPATTPFVLTTRTSDAMSYQMQVLDSNGHAVRTFSGSTAGAQPLSLSWDLKDAGGTRVPNGFYDMSLTGSGAAGPAVPYTVRVQLGPPDVPTSALPAMYTTTGAYTVGGVKYSSACSYPNLVLRTCSIIVYGAYWSRSGTTYVSRMGWLAYTTSYIAWDSTAWQTTVTAMPGTHSYGGYSWLTQCSPSVGTGTRNCWAYRLQPTVVKVAGAGGTSRFVVRQQYQFKALVSLTARPAP